MTDDTIAYCVDDGDGGLTVICCPFCGKKHYHGQPAGSRVAHCVNGRAREYVLVEVK